jgi:hypothetical protein
VNASGRIELADIFRAHGAAWLATHDLTRSRAKAWRAIISCRTEALGGHVEQCNVCGYTRQVYHSCRNRHCPKCQTRAKEQWVTARHRDLLPVPYYHLVFTIPHALNGLAASDLRIVTDILFAAASDTLIAFGANARWLGGELAFSLVLHTWSQNLQRHLHVHALLAGGALSDDGQWVVGKRGFLFPVKALSKVFRTKFIAALTLARSTRRLHQELADDAWRMLVSALWRHDWVVYAKEPLGGPSQVLEYLARYTHRVAISNERLLSLRQGQVAFRVRDNEHPGKKRIERMPADVFIGRFLQHVLPPGFKRIRHYGLLANCHKQRKLAQCRAALNMPLPDQLVIESINAFMLRVAQIDIGRCSHCACGQLHVIGVIAPHPMPLPCHATGPP